jgi:threonine/homoserine/homoserine lactone efflux protein
MGQGIGDVLTYAIGVAISPIPIIAVILMLFSPRARRNGPLFLAGWVVALAVVATVAYLAAHDGNAATNTTADDSVSWGKVVLGVAFFALAARNWRRRPAPGQTAEMPKWMDTVDGVSPVKAFGLGVVLVVLNPKNLVLTLGAAGGLAQLPGLTTSDAVVALVVFVVVASLGIAGPVAYAMFGGEKARAALESTKEWLGAHDAAVMGVLFLVFGVDLIAKGLPQLTH